jgi:hypothetical protein
MKETGAYDAKTRLPSLLEPVEQGLEVERGIMPAVGRWRSPMRCLLVAERRARVTPADLDHSLQRLASPSIGVARRLR